MNSNRKIRCLTGIGAVLPLIVGLGSQSSASSTRRDPSRTAANTSYELRRAAGGSYTGTNTAQQLAFEFTTPGARLIHGNGSGAFRLTGYGFGQHLRSPQQGELAMTGNRVEYRRGDVTEWYVNEAAGLEQGFTFTRRPGSARPGEALVISVALTGDFHPILSASGAEVVLQSKTQDALHYGGLRSVDARGRELPSRLEVREQEIRLLVDDRDAEYPVVVDPVTSTTFVPAPPPGPTYPVSTSNPAGIVAGEFNSCLPHAVGCLLPNDGNLDLVIANLGGRVDELTGNGDGTFNGPFPFGSGRGPRAIAAADFNGDGFQDVVVVNSYTGISVLLNLFGVLVSTPPGGYTAGATPEAVAVGDFNGDNCPDIAVTNNGDNTVSIFLNKCDGSPLRTFITPAPAIPVGLGPTGIAVGNFIKGDPNLDLAVVNSADGTVTILKGDGAGNFGRIGPPISLGVFGRTLDLGQCIAVGNLTKSGNQDIVIAGDQGVVVLLGNGFGGFQAPVVYAADKNPDGVAIADFNGDGVEDLAITNAFSNDLSVLIGKGDGTFPNPPADFPVGAFPTAVAAGDFNNDGRQDVAVTNFIDNTVTILLGAQWNIATCASAPCLLSSPPQATRVNTKFPLPLIARVTDALSNPVKGAEVSFVGPTSGPSATFSPSTPQTTDANGEVQVIATANGISGPAYSVTAIAGFSAMATFTLTNNPGIPSIAAVGGTPQSTGVGTAFPTKLTAQVTDSNGKGIPGIAVVFTVPTGAGVPGGTFPGNLTTITVSPTDSNGQAQTTFTANATPGTYLVSATAFSVGAPNTAVFVLTNTGPPASITAAGGTPQSVGVGNPFPGALVARVTDGPLGGGNPVQGAIVTFTVNPVGGAGGSFGSQTSVLEPTDSTGSATSPTLTANSTGGTYTVTASVAGVAQPAVFTLTNVGGSGALLPGNQTIRQNNSLQFAINLGTPAPSGGIIISLSSNNTSVVTVSPANILVPAGSSTSRGQVTLNAISTGTAQVTATAYGFVPDSTITVTVIPPLPQ